jgi:hypothetical protein
VVTGLTFVYELLDDVIRPIKLAHDVGVKRTYRAEAAKVLLEASADRLLPCTPIFGRLQLGQLRRAPLLSRSKPLAYEFAQHVSCGRPLVE